MKWTPEEITELERVAQVNDGHCDRCKRVIKIYRYKANRTMALTMRALYKAYKESGGINDIDVRDIQLVYGQRSQLSKVRLHGLIARVKDDGKVIQSHWLITKKGFAWLDGQAIPTKVVNFGNQVLGHDGGTITIHEALGEAPAPEKYEEQAISTAEARTYRDIRQPQKHMTMTAVFTGHSYSDKGPQTDKEYELEVERLQIGKPIKVVSPFSIEYKDIAAFQKAWRVAK